jgi:hypothetical protein
MRSRLTNATIFVDFGKLIWQLQNLVNFEKLMFKPFFWGQNLKFIDNLEQIKRVNGKPTFDFYFTLNTEKSIIIIFIYFFKIVNTEKKKLLKLYFNGLEKEKKKKEKLFENMN